MDTWKNNAGLIILRKTNVKDVILITISYY